MTTSSRGSEKLQEVQTLDLDLEEFIHSIIHSQQTHLLSAYLYEELKVC